jgi:8-hydroxy-5-deazaflavin:NADPH oxidoreductase
MEIAIVGTGFVGTTLGGALARAGHDVTFGSRHPEESAVAGTTVAPIGEALENAEVIVLCLPGAAVAGFASEHRDALDGKLVIDATNKMGEETANSRSSLPSSVRYVRAFNTLGGENMADPVFEEGRADMFFSGPAADRATAEAVIEGVGLRPVYVGEDEEALVDCLFRLWIALAVRQGRGRRLAFRLLDH